MSWKKIVIFTILIAIIIFNISFAQIVVIDPGHGGHDAGATSGDNYEKFYNLDISLKLAELLREKGVEVHLTRTSDVFVTLQARPQLAKELNADLFVSIHNNSHTASSANGTLNLYNSTNDSGNKLRNIDIATILKNNLVKATGLFDRGVVLRTDLAVLNRIGSIPATLVEVAFVSNPADLAKLNDENFRQKVAQSLCGSIIDVLVQLNGNKGSASIGNPNQCSECEGIVGSEWVDDGQGSHYRACKNGHKKSEGIHSDLDLDFKCDTCNSVITTCYLCKTVLIDSWFSSVDGRYHYKACTNSHMNYWGEHTWNNDVCSGCQLSNSILVNVVQLNDDVVLTLSHRDFKMNAIKSLRIELEGEDLFWKGKIDEESQSGNQKMINVMGNDLLIEDGKITLTIKNGTYLLNRLINNKEQLNFQVNNADVIMSVKATVNVDKNFYCKICESKAKADWIPKESIHILMCEKDNTHIMQIEEHDFDKNNICLICKYKKSEDYKMSFVDFVDKNHWAWENVGHMEKLGFIKGDKNEETGERYLYPEQSITAEGVISILARILGYDGIDRIDEESVYMPIESTWSEGEWKYLMKYLTLQGKDPEKEMGVLLSNNGISGSDEEIKDNYTKVISRERIFYLLGGFLKTINNNVSTEKFEDWESVNYSYRDNIKLLAEYNIVKGDRTLDEKLYVRPTVGIKVVEAVALIDRFYCVRELDL